MPPLWVQLRSFHSSRFCLICGVSKRKERRRNRYKGREEGVEQERRKHRKKMLRERKIMKKLIIRN